jgi:uncharacterized membrane protein YiaA
MFIFEVIYFISIIYMNLIEHFLHSNDNIEDIPVDSIYYSRQISALTDHPMIFCEDNNNLNIAAPFNYL